jgi:predicted DNA-binding transcriptional regulator AlpA
MRPPEAPDNPKGQSNKTTARGRHKLLQSSALSSEAVGSSESASSDSEGSGAADHSTAVRGETSPATASPAKDHPGQSARTERLESGDNPDSLIRQDQAALMLGVSNRCLENWRYRGGGPSWIRISARCIRYRRSDLVRFIEARVQTSTSDNGTNAS